MPSQPVADAGETFGLAIASDIPLPDLAPLTPGTKADVVMREGQVETWDETDPFAITPYLRAKQRCLWFDIPGKLAMRIEDGRSIVYRPHAGVPQDEVRLFLLGSGIGAILMQRGNLVLHANAIAMPGNGAIICLGRSGAGKSTTAGALMQRGYEVLGDDVCAIDSGNNIRRGVPRLKLWDDTVRRLALDASGLERFAGAHDKWNVPLAGKVSGARRPAMFVLLDFGEGTTVETRTISGGEKFVALRNNVYRHELVAALDIEAYYLERLARIASSTPMYRIARPRSGFTIDQVVDTIIDLYEPVAMKTQEGAG